MIEIEKSLRWKGIYHRYASRRIIYTLGFKIQILVIKVTKFLHIDVCKKLSYIRVGIHRYA